jgi:hypothetical protein
LGVQARCLALSLVSLSGLYCGGVQALQIAQANAAAQVQATQQAQVQLLQRQQTLQQVTLSLSLYFPLTYHHKCLLLPSIDDVFSWAVHRASSCFSRKCRRRTARRTRSRP